MEWKNPNEVLGQRNSMLIVIVVDSIGCVSSNVTILLILSNPCVLLFLFFFSFVLSRTEEITVQQAALLLVAGKRHL